MEQLDKKAIILSLIKDNLTNYKLVYGLERLGLMPDEYGLNLGDTIFKLMGFKASERTDFIFQVFMKNCKKVRQVSISGSEDGLKKLSEEIYKELILAKEMVEVKQLG